MDTATMHCHLRDHITIASDAEENAYRAMQRELTMGTAAGYRAAADEWQRRSAEHAGLIKAGLVITLGPLEEET